MGVDPLRFPEVDYSSAQNDFGGLVWVVLLCKNSPSVLPSTA
jgi:hypothetical protein